MADTQWEAVPTDEPQWERVPASDRQDVRNWKVDPLLQRERDFARLDILKNEEANPEPAAAADPKNAPALTQEILATSKKLGVDGASYEPPAPQMQNVSWEPMPPDEPQWERVPTTLAPISAGVPEGQFTTEGNLLTDKPKIPINYAVKDEHGNVYKITPDGQYQNAEGLYTDGFGRFSDVPFKKEDVKVPGLSDLPMGSEDQIRHLGMIGEGIAAWAPLKIGASNLSMVGRLPIKMIFAPLIGLTESTMASVAGDVHSYNDFMNYFHDGMQFVNERTNFNTPGEAVADKMFENFMGWWSEKLVDMANDPVGRTLISPALWLVYKADPALADTLVATGPDALMAFAVAKGLTHGRVPSTGDAIKGIADAAHNGNIDGIQRDLDARAKAKEPFSPNLEVFLSENDNRYERGDQHPSPMEESAGDQNAIYDAEVAAQREETLAARKQSILAKQEELKTAAREVSKQDLLKKAEAEHTFNEVEWKNAKQKTQDLEAGWALLDAERRTREWDQQVQADQVWEDRRPTAMQDAFQRAGVERAAGSTPNGPNLGKGAGGVLRSIGLEDPEKLANIPYEDRIKNRDAFLQDSTVQDRVYHATHADFTTFKNSDRDIGIHVGTQESANIRLQKLGDLRRTDPEGRTQNERIMPVHISLKNPLRTTDLGTWGSHSFTMDTPWAPSLLERLGFPRDEVKRIPSDVAKVREYLKSKGHDGIVYKNMVEREMGKSPPDSYIVFDPNQIKSATGNHGSYDRTFNSILRSIGIEDPEEILRRLHTSPGSEVEYTLNRGTGHETHHTGHLVRYEPDPLHVYVRSAEGDLVALEPHDVDHLNVASTAKETVDWVVSGGGHPSLLEVFKAAGAEFGDLSKAEDINKRLGVQTAHNRDIVPYLHAVGTLKQAANFITKWLGNGMRRQVNLEHSWNAETIKGMVEPFENHFNLKKLGGPTKTDVVNFRKVANIWNDMQKDPESWGFNGHDYYPTDEWFRSKGLDEKFIPINRMVLDTMERYWDRELEAARRNMGTKIPPRIPGYMPDVFRGAWKVRMYTEEIDVETGEVHQRQVSEFNSHSQKEMKAKFAWIQKTYGDQLKVQGIKVVTEKPSAEPLSKGNLQDSARLAEAFENNPALQAMMLDMHRRSAEGIIPSILQRQSPPKYGHMLERAGYEEGHPLGLTGNEMRDTLGFFRRYIESVNGWVARSRFMEQTYFPLMESGFMADKPNMRSYVDSALMSYLRIPATMEMDLNNWIRDLAIRHGKDPNLPRNMFDLGAGGVNFAYLFARPAFWLQQIGQRALTHSVLTLADATRQLHGLPGGNVGVAVGKAILEFQQFYMGGWTGNALRTKPSYIRWFEEHGYTDPGYNKTAIGTKVLPQDKVASGFEAGSRLHSAMAGYHYFKALGYPEKEALQAAGQLADGVNVPYQPQFGPQIWIQNQAMIERFMLRFTTFPAHYFGLMDQQLSVMYKGGKQALLGDARAGQKLLTYNGEEAPANRAQGMRASTKALLSMASMGAVMLSLWGIKGLPFAKNYDDIVNWFNNATGNSIPSATRVAREFDKFLPDWLRFGEHGIVSNTFKVDVHGSGEGPSVTNPIGASSNLIDAIFSSVWLGTREFGYAMNMPLFHKPVTPQEWMEVIKTFPGGMAGGLEYWVKKGSPSFVLDMAKDGVDVFTRGPGGNFPNNTAAKRAGQMVDTSASKEILTEQGYKRNTLESYMRAIIGYVSTYESEWKNTQRWSEQERKAVDSTWQALEQRAKEKGLLHGRDLDTAIHLAATYGPDKMTSLLKSIAESQLKATMTPHELKIFRGLNTAEDVKFYLDWLKLRQTQTDRRQ